MRPRSLLVSVLLALGLPAVPAAAQPKPDPEPLARAGGDRPDHASFGEAYRAAGEPVFLLLVGPGTRPEDLVRFDPGGDAELVRSAIERHLLTARVEVVDPSTLPTVRQREIEILALQGASDALEVLARELGSDVRVVVGMLPSTRSDVRWRVTVDMIQVRRGRKIGSFAFDWRQGTDSASIQRYAAAIARKLFEDFGAWYAPGASGGQARSYTLRLVGVAGARELLTARDAFADIPGVVRIRERGFTLLGGESVATLRVDFVGRTFELMADLQESAAGSLGMQAEISDAATGTITLVAAPAPAVATAQSSEADRARLDDELSRRFRAEYELEGRPKIAVLVNRDLTPEDARDPELAPRIDAGEVPVPADTRASAIQHGAETAVVVNLHMGPSGPVPAPLPAPVTPQPRGNELLAPVAADGRRMEDYLYKRFVQQLQVRMVDPDFARDRLRNELEIDRDVLTEKELAFMLGRVAGVDIVVQGVGRVDRTEHGHTVGYSFRAVRVSDGMTLAADGWAETLPAGDEALMDRRMEEIADRIVAQLAEQMLVSWSPPRTLSVMLTNAQTQKDVFVVMAALESHVGEISDATFERHVTDGGGIGMFTIRYESSYEDLIQQVMEQELRLNVGLDASNTTRDTLTLRIQD